MDTINDFYENIGNKVNLKTSDGQYEGIISHVNKQFSRVKLNRTFLLPAKKFMGTLFFFEYEIESYVVLTSEGTNETELDNLYRSTLNQYKKSSKKYTTSHVYYSDSECASQSVDDGENIERSEEKYVFVPPEKFQKLLPTDLIIIEDVDSEFMKIIDLIKKELVIGVSFEGPKIKRNGILTWISVSTPLHTFIFDMNSLKSAGFDKGLRSIFEDPLIEKIIHDSRNPADCLFNMFYTKLVNIFDTQVADYLYRYEKKENSKKYTRTLNSCLGEYLDISKIFLYEAQTHNSFQSLVNSYNIRPISDKFKDLMMKNVVYLLPLKKKLEMLLLEPFHNAVRIYSSSISCCSEMELLLEPSVPNKIPFQLMIEKLNMIRFKKKCSAPAVVSTGYQYQSPFLFSVGKMTKQSSMLKRAEDLKEPYLQHSNVQLESSDSEKMIFEKNLPITRNIKQRKNDAESDEVPWEKFRDALLPHCDYEYKKNYKIFPG